MLRIWTTLLLCAGLAAFSAGCQKADQNKEAVQAGLEEYLKNRAGLDMNSMEMKVTSVTFRGTEADVAVSFQAKGASDAANGMQMKYVMEQKGGKWVVKGRSGSSEHGGPDAPPAGGGGMGGSGGGMGSGGGGGMAMPPDHPPTGGEKK